MNPEIEFPKRIYHPTEESFVCPSKEFLNTLKTAKEWDDIPFTGPRKHKPESKCAECKIQKKLIASLEDELALVKKELEAANDELTSLKAEKTQKTSKATNK